ncbi:hypothetical protein BHM03_00026110 [Ensete ventricosum]|nr:hypothetical protein BHM03_00026110 [Ensete ventricosum]
MICIRFVVACRSRVSNVSSLAPSTGLTPDPADSGTANTLATMWSNFDVDLIVTTHWLVGVRKNYFIPPEYELHAPLPGERPYDAFSSGFSLSIDAL